MLHLRAEVGDELAILERRRRSVREYQRRKVQTPEGRAAVTAEKRAYRAAHPEHQREYQREYRQLPGVRERKNAGERESRRRKAAAEGRERLPSAQREKLIPPVADRRRLRQAAGLSTTDMAAQLGVSGRTIGNWECGEVTPGSRDLCERYARLLAWKR